MKGTLSQLEKTVEDPCRGDPVIGSRVGDPDGIAGLALNTPSEAELPPKYSMGASKVIVADACNFICVDVVIDMDPPVASTVTFPPFVLRVTLPELVVTSMLPVVTATL